jgi:hypothetical protein
MDLPYIFESFKKLETAHEKVEFLKDLQKLNLHFDIRYDRLIEIWSTRC